MCILVETLKIALVMGGDSGAVKTHPTPLSNSDFGVQLLLKSFNQASIIVQILRGLYHTALLANYATVK